MVTSWENRAAPALSVYSSIAQSVERMTVNHDVAGSSPAWGAKAKGTQTNHGVLNYTYYRAFAISC